jgi:flagella basal body P-ring formation protein FlgA
MIRLLLLSPVVAMVLEANASGCHPLAGDQILSAELGRAIAAFASLPPDLALGYSPMPGAKRVLRTEDLQRIARSHGIEPQLWTAVCFEVPMSLLKESDALQAMRLALDGLPDATIGIQSLAPPAAPNGKLVFPRSGLVVPSSGAGESMIWRGFIQYSANRRFKVTATVDIQMPLTRVVAARDLKVGSAIEASDVRLEDYQGFPEGFRAIAGLDEVIGRLPRRSIASGHSILALDLTEPPTVRKGDRVQVEVRNGASLLKLEAQAAATGRTGDWIQVKNLDSGKLFGARIEASGKVKVLAGGGH